MNILCVQYNTRLPEENWLSFLKIFTYSNMCVPRDYYIPIWLHPKKFKIFFTGLKIFCRI